MNKVIIAGIIIDRTYKFVDKVYAIIVINLELEDHKENVKIIAKNNIADYMYRFCKIKDKILIEGNLQNTTDGLMVIVNNVEKLNGKVDKKSI